MPKFLKTLFPKLEKPEDASQMFGDAFAGITAMFTPPQEEPAPIVVAAPNSAITSAGKAMPLLGPLFSLEADLQAFVTNLGSYDAPEVQAEITDTITSAPCV